MGAAEDTVEEKVKKILEILQQQGDDISLEQNQLLGQFASQFQGQYFKVTIKLMNECNYSLMIDDVTLRKIGLEWLVKNVHQLEKIGKNAKMQEFVLSLLGCLTNFSEEFCLLKDTGVLRWYVMQVIVY